MQTTIQSPSQVVPLPGMMPQPPVTTSIMMGAPVPNLTVKASQVNFDVKMPQVNLVVNTPQVTWDVKAPQANLMMSTP